MAHPKMAPASNKMTSFLARLNPVPAFEEYSGPYKVGTIDIEIPVADLESPAPAPDNASDIETVQFRIFYPTLPDAEGKRISWLPAPQRDHLSAYIQFLGAGPLLAQAASFLPRHLHYTSIPVIKNAPLLEPDTENKRWPTCIFSHGLGGNRNAYSSIVGALASHGTVVITPEHRDGSAAVTFMRIPSQQDRYFVRNTRRIIPYNRIAHDVNPSIYAARNDQLRIRLWELGLVHSATLALDNHGGRTFTNLNKSTPSANLASFASALHVQDPGSIIFAGHSFGAATTVQFLKTVYYANHPALQSMPDRLYLPANDSPLRNQITNKTVTMLLDMWSFPLLSPLTKPLFSLPLPLYDVSTSPSFSLPAGGKALLAINSADFFKWTEHLHVQARILSPRPDRGGDGGSCTIHAEDFRRGGQPDGTPEQQLAEPNWFYVQSSAHLNQSDFGLLFPMLTKRVFGSKDPERAIRLNMRAVLQVLRANEIEVGRSGWDVVIPEGGDINTTAEGVKVLEDSEDSSEEEEGRVTGGGRGEKKAKFCGGTNNDEAILRRTRDAAVEEDKESSTAGVVEAWGWIDIVGMGEVPMEKRTRMTMPDDEVAIYQAKTNTTARTTTTTTTALPAASEEPEMASVIETNVVGRAEQQEQGDVMMLMGGQSSPTAAFTTRRKLSTVMETPAATANATTA